MVRTNPNPGHKKRILPGLQVPSGLPPEVQKFLQGLKEHIEQYIGAKGQPKERFVTLRDLEEAGLINVVVKSGRGEIGETAETAAAGSTATSRSSATTLSFDVAGRVDGDVLRYSATLNKWQRYPSLTLVTDHEAELEIAWSQLVGVPAMVSSIADLVDPGNDAVPYWDDSTGDFVFGTFTEITAALDVFTDSAQGVVPASGGGTSNFLRADGTWALPPGAGGDGYPSQLAYAGIF